VSVGLDTQFIQITEQFGEEMQGRGNFREFREKVSPEIINGAEKC
jgi:hypothetical protein